MSDNADSGKTPLGRPPLYATAEELGIAIDEYFNYCVREERKPTLAGLAYDLGYVSKQSVYDQEKRGDAFSYHIKRARLKIESYHEARLYETGATGSMCWLNNHAGYVSRQEITGKDGGPLESVNLTYEQALARLAELRKEDGDAQ